MASIYIKGKKIYISWYDFTLQKRLNKSLNLDHNSKNWRQAQLTKKQFEEQLKKEKEKIKGLALKRNNIGEAFEHFLRNNSSKHVKTIKGYHHFYKKFKQAFIPNDRCTVITKLRVEEWLNDLKKFDYKRNTVCTYYRQLNHFLNFLFEYNYLPMFRINKDVKPKVENVEKIVISLEDLALIFEMLLEEKKNNNFKCLIYLLYYTGLRSTDLLSIQIENVNVKDRIIKFFSPKRKVYREISFHEDLVSWFENIRSQKLSGKILEYGNEQAIQKAVSRYFAKIEISSKKYSSRSFRKTFVTIARKNKMDETIVKELVGHAHSTTTDKFYNKIDHDQMKEGLQQYITVNQLPYDQIRDRVIKLRVKKEKSNITEVILK